MKFIFISGGVISGLGKGVITSSVGLLLKNRGLKIAPVKIDMYLNVDAGTLRPQEHGETFVLASGLETDQDMGNYERFLNEDLPPENYITTGQIYSEVIRKERAFEYEGTTVEAVPHVTDEIIRRIKLAGEKSKADVVIIELGGTVGEYQNGIFFEAARIMKLRAHSDVVNIHVTYLPLVRSVGELKSKPAQTSVHILNSMGIQPDLIVARSEVAVDQKRADKLALFCNVDKSDVIFSPDLESIYKVPQLLADQKAEEKILNKLNLSGHSGKSRGYRGTHPESVIFDSGQARLAGALAKRAKMTILNQWQKYNRRADNFTHEITVGIVAKYFKSGDYDLSDSYVSVLESLKHAGSFLETKVNLKWMNSEGLEEKTEEEIGQVFAGTSGIIVPQGWGSRGVEGKIRAVQFARGNKIPYLGLCFGMQMAVIEFARNVCGLKGANSTEVDPKTKYPVIHIMPDQKEYLSKRQYGGTIRLGQWQAKLELGIRNKGLRTRKTYDRYFNFAVGYYKNGTTLERHRHRYEVNNEYREILESNGLVISGTSPDGKLVEVIELTDHPFFVGTQYHPELQSRPLAPHPLFLGFLESVLRLDVIPAHEPGSSLSL